MGGIIWIIIRWIWFGWIVINRRWFCFIVLDTCELAISKDQSVFRQFIRYGPFGNIDGALIGYFLETGANTSNSVALILMGISTVKISFAGHCMTNKIEESEITKWMARPPPSWDIHFPFTWFSFWGLFEPSELLLEPPPPELLLLHPKKKVDLLIIN